MKVLGVKQFHQKTFKMLAVVCQRLAVLLGNVPRHFVLVVYGYTGNGKTEFCIQLAKELAQHGTVGWLSYEQGHGVDLQMATQRNDMEELSGNFYIIDPVADIKPGHSLLQDLDLYLSKRSSADFIFIDSLDYTGFSYDDYKYLKEKYAGRKSFIFIAHGKPNGKPKKAVTEHIIFDGGMGFQISNFIARPEKNRFGGKVPYVVYEELARERDPLFFSKRDK